MVNLNFVGGRFKNNTFLQLIFESFKINNGLLLTNVTDADTVRIQIPNTQNMYTKHSNRYQTE